MGAEKEPCLSVYGHSTLLYGFWFSSFATHRFTSLDRFSIS